MGSMYDARIFICVTMAVSMSQILIIKLLMRNSYNMCTYAVRAEINTTPVPMPPGVGKGIVK